jgi:hypothetical protein
MTKYVIVTAISSYRMRYCIPVDELQELNVEVPVEGREMEWAEDCVTCNEVEEFSQKHIGETIIDSEILTEEQMLKKFDADNDYLKDWTREKKIQHVRNWKNML